MGCITMRVHCRDGSVASGSCFVAANHPVVDDQGYPPHSRVDAHKQ